MTNGRLGVDKLWLRGAREGLAFDDRLAAVTVDFSGRVLWHGRFEAITISYLEAAANIYLGLAIAAQTG